MKLKAMLGRSFAESSPPCGALPRVTALLSQQERLFGHPWSNADIYLYDFRAQQISTLITELEDEERLKRRTISLAETPVQGRTALSLEECVSKRRPNPDRWAKLVAASSRTVVSNVLGGFWAFLALRPFREGQKHESSSSAAVT